MEHSRISAVVLAAGLSSRMGRFKPLLDLGGAPAIRRTVEALQLGGIEDVRVVLGYSADRVAPLVRELGATVLLNRSYALGMFSSIQTGVHSLARGASGFLLLPADIPLLRATTVRRLVQAAGKEEAPVYYPTFLGRRGHPPLISAALVPEILASEPLGNLRAILEDRSDHAVDVPCADEAILMDMDREEDYERMKRHLAYSEIPTRNECAALLRLHGVPETIIRHGEAVAELGLRIAESLERHGSSRLDLNLVVAACLLHDIARGRPDHSRAGAALLREEGYPAVADCVDAHMDLQLPAGESWNFGEKEILYLADKLVREDRIVSLDARFAAAERDGSAVPAVADKVRSRRDTARRLMLRVEESSLPSSSLPWMVSP